MADLTLSELLTSRPLHVIAVGKAAAGMAAALVAVPHLSIRHVLAIGTHRHDPMPPVIEWLASSHPFPDDRSEVAAERALAVARGVHSGEVLLILLSGGASALMASWLRK